MDIWILWIYADGGKREWNEGCSGQGTAGAVGAFATQEIAEAYFASEASLFNQSVEWKQQGHQILMGRYWDDGSARYCKIYPSKVRYTPE